MARKWGSYRENQSITRDQSEVIDNKINTAARMFGMPHQLLAHNDPRLSIGVDLGRTYAQTIIMEAPSIFIKPGIASFLPGKSDEEKKNWFQVMYDAATNNDKTESTMMEMIEAEEDSLQYYDHEAKYTEYMKGVNMIAHVMAVLLGIDDVEVPWVDGHVSFGYYDWRYYRLGKQFKNPTAEIAGDDISDGGGWLCDEPMKDFDGLDELFGKDTEYVQFYVDANASFSESASNNTTQSMLEGFTEQIEGYAKELGMISGMVDSETLNNAKNSINSSVDSLINGVGGLNEGIGKLIGRLKNGAKQIISGGNFQIPEIYSDSNYSKNYSFAITASTPYGDKLAWYLNVGIVIAHVLGLVLPLQISANTYKSPYLVKCFSPGWFNCSLGIIDQVGIDKGDDQSWSIYGLPNTVKISVSVKDLYSGLSMPMDASEFMKNSGMMEFLMTNCGIDITNQKLSSKFEVWANLMLGNIRDAVTATPFKVGYKIRNAIADKILLWN